MNINIDCWCNAEACTVLLAGDRLGSLHWLVIYHRLWCGRVYDCQLGWRRERAVILLFLFWSSARLYTLSSKNNRVLTIILQVVCCAFFRLEKCECESHQVNCFIQYEVEFTNQIEGHWFFSGCSPTKWWNKLNLLFKKSEVCSAKKVNYSKIA